MSDGPGDRDPKQESGLNVTGEVKAWREKRMKEFIQNSFWNEHIKKE